MLAFSHNEQQCLFRSSLRPKRVEEVQDFTINIASASEEWCEPRLCVKRYSLPSSKDEFSVVFRELFPLQNSRVEGFTLKLGGPAVNYIALNCRLAV